MARDDCGLCFGRGKLTCSMCSGAGYRREFGERVTCSCSGGYVQCQCCEGTGRRRVTMAGPGSLDENTTDARDRASPKEPLSVAELQICYDEAVREARKKQKDLLGQIERDQLDKRTRLDWDSHWRFRHWVQDLDLEAPGISEELSKADADLKRLGKDDLAFDVLILSSICFRIDTYRLLMNQEKKEE
jgi:hypothetical protein